jgi:tetratricopeptide (TPR) repeat protein
VHARRQLLDAAARPAEALGAHARAVRAAPGLLAAQHNRGAALAAAGREVLAEQEQEQGQGRAQGRGQALLREAVVCFRAALDLQPRHVLVAINLGAAHTALGQPEEAMAQYEAVLRHTPTQPLALYNRASELERGASSPQELATAAQLYARAAAALEGGGGGGGGGAAVELGGWTAAGLRQQALCSRAHALVAAGGAENCQAAVSSADAAVQLGAARGRRGDTLAMAYFSRALALEQLTERLDEAVASYAQAAKAQGGVKRGGLAAARSLSNRGNALLRLAKQPQQQQQQRRRRLEAAARSCEHAQQAAPVRSTVAPPNAPPN